MLSTNLYVTVNRVMLGFAYVTWSVPVSFEDVLIDIKTNDEASIDERRTCRFHFCLFSRTLHVIWMQVTSLQDDRTINAGRLLSFPCWFRPISRIRC